MNGAFSTAELERYARHIVLPEIGGAGQQRLQLARVVVVGVGGLGSPVALYLAAAGIGTIGLCDDDAVSLSNLQRQVLFATADIGRPKVAAAAEKLRALDPAVAVVLYRERLEAENAAALLAGYDLAVDGSDNAATRYLLADACEAAAIPLVTAAVGRFDGSLTTLMPYRDGNPRYRDLFPTPPREGSLPACAETGIVGALTGVLGSLQALEVLKLVAGFGEPLIGRLLLFDGLSGRFEEIRYRRRTGAP